MRAKGTVKRFNESKGYGVIRRDGDGREIFVRYDDIAGVGFRTLSEGERVSFECVRGPKGLHAVAVRSLGEES